MPKFPYDAACDRAGVDRDRFYPVAAPGTPLFDDDVAYARSICGACPVLVECLTAALRLEEGQPESMRFGVWGGATPRERAALVATPAGVLAQRTADRALARRLAPERLGARPVRTGRAPARTGRSRQARIRGACPVCTIRQHLRADMTIMQHEHRWAPCEGTGQFAIEGTIVIPDNVTEVTVNR